MKNIYALATLILLFSGSFLAQVKLIEPGTTTDLNGQTIELTDVPSVSSLDLSLYVINTGSQSVTMICTRTEVDGLAGTKNSTCWQVCPETLNTGAKPVYTVNISGTNLEETAMPGDTITSFEAHYYPQGLDGCSLFKYEWKDGSTGTVYAYVYVRYIHQSSGTCTASSDDIAVDFDLYPNPTNGSLNVQLSDSYSSDLNIRIVDVLGKVVSNTVLGAGNVFTSVSTESLVDGVYFVTFETANKTVLTKKIVVRH